MSIKVPAVAAASCTRDLHAVPRYFHGKSSQENSGNRWIHNSRLSDSQLSLAEVLCGCGLAKSLHGSLNARATFSEVLCIHSRPDRKPGVECEKPGLSDSG